MTRSYRQYCPVAHALDVVGERWSLLVVRELMHGPLRYTDLLERLPGCGTNVLAARLRELEQGGVARRRRLPPPAASTVYELTEKGTGLKPVLRALAHWGIRSLGPPGPGDVLAEGWLERALRSAVADAAPDGVLAFRVDGEQATIRNRVTEPAAADDADVVVSTDPHGLYRLLVDADLGAARIEGDVTLVERLLAELVPAAALPAAV